MYIWSSDIPLYRIRCRIGISNLHNSFPEKQSSTFQYHPDQDELSSSINSNKNLCTNYKYNKKVGILPAAILKLAATKNLNLLFTIYSILRYLKV